MAIGVSSANSGLLSVTVGLKSGIDTTAAPNGVGAGTSGAGGDIAGSGNSTIGSVTG